MKSWYDMKLEYDIKSGYAISMNGMKDTSNFFQKLARGQALKLIFSLVLL